MLEENIVITVCEICESGPLSKLYPMEMMYGKEGPFEYVCCGACGSTYQSHRLDDYGRFCNPSYYAFKFDWVLFNHALEHSLTPFKDLQEATRFLKPEVEIVVRIPVSDSEISKRYDQYW